MPSVFHGIEIAKRALFTHQRALDTTAHNIANANTPGYTKQEAIVGVTAPYTLPALNRPITPGQIGTGVEIKSIRRFYDEYITTRLREEDRSYSQWEIIYNITREIEGIFNEPKEGGINSLIDRFFVSFEELSKNPQNLAIRMSVVQEGEKLTSAINYVYQRLTQIQFANNERIRLQIDEINSKAKQIAELNSAIIAVEGVGNNANDLRDKRDNLLSELSQIIDISTEEWEQAQFVVYIGGKVLVQNDKVMELKTQANTVNPQMLDVLWAGDNDAVAIRGGKLKAYIDARDTVVPYYQEQINQIVKDLVREVNSLHSSGYGLLDSNGNPWTGYNFFKVMDMQTKLSNVAFPEYKGIIQGIIQLPEGTTISTTIDKLGVTAGTFTIDGEVFSLSTQDVSGANVLTLQNVLDKISDSGSISAYYNSENRKIILEKKYVSNISSANFTVGEETDTSNFLTASVSGLQSATEGNYGAHITIITSDAGARITVDDNIKQDIAKIAAASTKEGVPGDGSNALAIAKLRQQKTTGGIPPTGTYEEFYRGIITQIGLDVYEAKHLTDNYEMQKKTLENRREEISGVSIDEELTKMIKYQHSYNAAARLFTVMSEMIDTILAIGMR